MPAITIRNLPEPVHNALRRIAAERRMSVEALARAALSDLAGRARASGIDFAKLARDRAAPGLTEDGPDWTEALDRGPGRCRVQPPRSRVGHRVNLLLDTHYVVAIAGSLGRPA
jgi:plasmid stability protein